MVISRECSEQSCSELVLLVFLLCSKGVLWMKMMQVTNSIGDEVAVDPDVDPEQYPPLFFFKSTYSPSGIASI